MSKISALLLWMVLSASAQSNPAASATAAPPVYRGTLYAYLGVFLGDAPDGKGALVGKVVADSPAAKAGLQADDVIKQFDKTMIESAAQVYRLLGDTPPGSTVTLNIQRVAGSLSLPVQLGERQVMPDACQRLYAQSEAVQAQADRLRQMADEARQKGDENGAKRLLAESTGSAKQAVIYREDVDRAISEGKTGMTDCRQTGKPSRAQFGVNAIPLSEQLAQFFKLKESAGLLITEVKAGSLAERHGLKAGDCLVTANGKRIASVNELNRLLNHESDTAVTAAKEAEPEITLVIVRDGNERTLKFSLP